MFHSAALDGATEQLVKGLLTARYSYLLLATTLANNPSLVDQATLFLAQILKVQADFSDAGPNSSLLQESTLTPTTAAAKTSSGVIHQHGGFVPSQTCLSAAPTDCANAALQTLISLCQLAPSFASTCREALVYTGTLLEMVLHITEEVLRDELEFLSRLIFSKEATSQWILSHLGARQRARDSLVLPPLGKKKVTSGIETDSVSEKEGSVARIRAALLADARYTCQKMGWGGRLHAHVRLYCVLVRAGDLSPTHEEVEFWLKALATSLGQPEFVSERTLQLGIAFVCLVPGLSGPSTRNMFHAAMGRLLRAAIMPGPLLYTPLNIILAVWVAVQLLLRKFADIAVVPTATFQTLELYSLEF
jgi:integrator complex subunit 2